MLYNSQMRLILRILAALLILGLAFFFLILPGQIENSMNAVTHKPPYNISARAQALQKTLQIVDLHADSLLWSRDLLEHGTRGHVDIPRLIEANVALQAFTIVSKTPRGQNFQSNTGDTDNILPLAIAERWPVASWFSLKRRALYQAARLDGFAARSQGKFRVIHTPADLQTYLDQKRANPAITAGFLGIEGAQVLEGDIENVDVMYNAGFRMMSPAHFFDTEFSGSAAGAQKGGLTDLGRAMLRRMEARRMLVDIAHASPKTIDDVLAFAARPVVVSHSGVKGTCDNIRNLSDDHLRGVARTGGIVGIAYFEVATCGTDAAAIARAIRHAVNVAGIDHVALGSDYDGAIEAPFDTTGLGLIVDALLAIGFNDDEIASIMGGNAIRLLLTNL